MVESSVTASERRQAASREGRHGRGLGVAIAAVAAASTLAGCASVRVVGRTSTPGLRAVRVMVFERDADLKLGRLTRRPIVTSLRVGGRRGSVLVESSEPRWVRSDLAPGRYCVVLEGRRTPSGGLRRLTSDDWVEFDITGDETVEVSVVVSSDRNTLRVLFLPLPLVDAGDCGARIRPMGGKPLPDSSPPGRVDASPSPATGRRSTAGVHPG